MIQPHYQWRHYYSITVTCFFLVDVMSKEIVLLFNEVTSNYFSVTRATLDTRMYFGQAESSVQQIYEGAVPEFRACLRVSSSTWPTPSTPARLLLAAECPSQ